MLRHNLWRERYTHEGPKGLKILLSPLKKWCLETFITHLTTLKFYYKEYCRFFTYNIQSDKIMKLTSYLQNSVDLPLSIHCTKTADLVTLIEGILNGKLHFLRIDFPSSSTVNHSKRPSLYETLLNISLNHFWVENLVLPSIARRLVGVNECHLIIC